MSRHGRYELTPLEIASMRCFGDDEADPLPAPAASPVAALEAAMLPALRRPPCLLAFSGGRDSSALLAVAVRLARREGLPPPVPATLRVRDAPRAEESEWQELTARHTGVDDWVRIELTDELDFVGAAAQKLLRRHGLLWPANLHFFVPLLEEAAGGSLITGVGADIVLASGLPDLMGQSRARAATRNAVRRVYRALPAAARRPYVARQVAPDRPWLRPDAARALTRELLELRPEPVALAARLDYHYRQRTQVLTRYGLGLLAADEDARIVHPFVDPGFLASLGRFLGRRGAGGRTKVMRALFGDLLPEAVVMRPTKASFAEAFCGPHSRRLIRDWDGDGVDPALVDTERLRAFWRDGSDMQRLGRTALLLQAAWLGRAASPSATAM